MHICKSLDPSCRPMIDKGVFWGYIGIMEKNMETMIYAYSRQIDASNDRSGEATRLERNERGRCEGGCAPITACEN